jgi:uncharacterized protein YeaO (DUF488 family)
MPEAERVKLKRAYDKPTDDDGYRILVDRIWPRGASKEKLKIGDWAKDVAPSTELRKWFGHDPDKWDEFKRRYFRELNNKKEMVDEIRAQMKHHVVTFVFSAKDEKFNNAVALKEYLEDHGKREKPQ